MRWLMALAVGVALVDGVTPVERFEMGNGPRLAEVKEILAGVEAAESTEALSAGASDPEEGVSGERVTERVRWDRLADCETGDWLAGGGFAERSARWRTGHPVEELDERAPWSSGLYYGGLQWSLRSWRWAAPDGLADVHPGEASREQEIVVAERLKELQGGATAWPTCWPLISGGKDG